MAPGHGGIDAVLRAMTTHGAHRLVCVSSTTVADGDAPGETLLWRKGVVPLLRHVLGRTLYDDMVRMEAAVRASSVDWTIVRPAGLFDAAEPTSDHEVSPGRRRGRFTSRADLAHTLLAEATDPQHPSATLEVVTRSGLPSPRQLMAKEIFGIGGTTTATR